MDQELSPGMQIVFSLLQILAPLLVGVIGWAVAKLAGYLKSKTKNEMLAGALCRLGATVTTAVREAENTLVSAIRDAKKPGSPGGERLTKVEAEQIKAAVLAKVKELWGARGLDELGKVLGLTPEKVDTLIAAKIEEAVLQDKRAEALANPQ